MKSTRRRQIGLKRARNVLTCFVAFTFVLQLVPSAGLKAMAAEAGVTAQATTESDQTAQNTSSADTETSTTDATTPTATTETSTTDATTPAATTEATTPETTTPAATTEATTTAEAPAAPGYATSDAAIRTASAQDAVPGKHATSVTASQDGLTLQTEAAWVDETHVDGNYNATDALTVSGIAAAKQALSDANTPAADSKVAVSEVIASDWSIDTTTLESGLENEKSQLAAEGIDESYAIDWVTYQDDGTLKAVDEGTANSYARITYTLDFDKVADDPSTEKPYDSATVTLPLTLSETAQANIDAYEPLSSDTSATYEGTADGDGTLYSGGATATLGTTTVTATAPELQVAEAEVSLAAQSEDPVITPQADLGTGSTFPASANDGDTFIWATNNVTYVYHTAYTTAAGASVPAGWYPNRLVNSGFDWPTWSAFPNISWRHWTAIDTTNGQYVDSWGGTAATWANNMVGWDPVRFGWTSNQVANSSIAEQHAKTVELQRENNELNFSTWNSNNTMNVYAELCAYQLGTAIYQDVATTPGAVYKWKLNHASIWNDYLDKMTVMIGEPGSETTSLATRVTTNGVAIQSAYHPQNPTAGGVGDSPSTGTNGSVDTNAVGWQSDVIQTPAALVGGWDHTSLHTKYGDWETWQGSYDATSNVTRFTFKSVASPTLNNGNHIDTITFEIAYPLYYHSNMTDITEPDPEGLGKYREIDSAGDSVKLDETEWVLGADGKPLLDANGNKTANISNDSPTLADGSQAVNVANDGTVTKKIVSYNDKNYIFVGWSTIDPNTNTSFTGDTISGVFSYYNGTTKVTEQNKKTDYL